MKAPKFLTGIGTGTTYPDYKPAPFIVSSEHEGVDMVTVVTEGIFSYCGVKVKIDTDRFIGPEQSAVRSVGSSPTRLGRMVSRHCQARAYAASSSFASPNASKMRSIGPCW